MTHNALPLTFFKIITFCVVAFLVFSPLAQAQVQPEDRGFGNDTVAESVAEPPSQNTTQDGATGSVAPNTQGAGPPAPAPAVDEDSWDFKIKKAIYSIFISAGGMVTWVGGNMLDYAIQKLVIEFGRLLTENLGLAVDAIWETVRDTINIIFIFVLIWIGLRTILQADDSNLKKQIGYLIAAALLINFSLFIAKAVVDFSNIAAVQISNAFVVTGLDAGGNPYYINGGILGGIDPTTDRLEGDGSVTEISAAFMHATKLSSYAGQLVVAGESLGFVFAFSILIFFMMLIAGFVFMAGAILLIIRFVVLTIALMFSPMMFLGWIYPGLKGLSDKWVHIFLKNAFVAPAYLFMLYIALAIIGDGENGFGFNPNGSVASAGGGDALSFGVFLYFALVIGFLIASVKVAEMMGAHGSKAVVKFGKMGASMGASMSAKAIGASTFGLTARAGRNSIGNLSQRFSDSNWIKDRAAKSGLGGTLARGTLKTARYAGDGSFDVRNIKNLGKKTFLGEGRKGGYKTVRGEIEKKEKAFAKSLGEIDDEDTQIKTITGNISDQKAAIKVAEAERDRSKQVFNKLSEGDPEYENAKKDFIEKAKNVESAKNKLNDLESAKQQEKYRRQIGSDGVIEKIEGAKAKLEDVRKEKKKLEDRFRNISNADTDEKEKVNKLIKDQQDEIKAIKQEIKKQTGSLGYAGILEKRSRAGSWWYGRMRSQDRHAGKEIRKQYEKVSKRTKEDRNTDNIIDALKTSK